MLNFLLDIAPDKSQLLLTIKLAGILREKKQEVYYTYTSNPAFTPVLYDKGISNCVLYPDDFRWLKPDLTLLDCRHAAHASLYRQLAIDYIFISMQLPDQKNIQDKDISILYLPPTPYLSSGSGPRLETLTKRLQDIKKDKERNIIVGLLGKGNKNSKILEDFYRVIKRSSIRNPRYQFILLTDIPNVYQSSELPDNMELFRHVEPHFFIRTVSITAMFQPIRKINLIGIDLHCVPIACFRQCIVAIACQRMDRVRW